MSLTRGEVHLSCNQTKLTQLQQASAALPYPALSANDIITITRQHHCNNMTTALCTVQPWHIANVSRTFDYSVSLVAGRMLIAGCDALLNAFMPHKRDRQSELPGRTQTSITRHSIYNEHKFVLSVVGWGINGGVPSTDAICKHYCCSKWRKGWSHRILEKVLQYLIKFMFKHTALSYYKGYR